MQRNKPRKLAMILLPPLGMDLEIAELQLTIYYLF